MSKIQLVIEISEEEYNRMKEKKMFGNVTVWKNAICNGTPLPKGHGRIGDLDILVKHNVISESYANMFTIIEADKAESEDEE